VFSWSQAESGEFWQLASIATGCGLRRIGRLLRVKCM